MHSSVGDSHARGPAFCAFCIVGAHKLGDRTLRRKLTPNVKLRSPSESVASVTAHSDVSAVALGTQRRSADAQGYTIVTYWQLRRESSYAGKL